jgi:hypothetical protein
MQSPASADMLLTPDSGNADAGCALIMVGPASILEIIFTSGGAAVHENLTRNCKHL